MKPEALQLANAIGISSEHPDYPVIDWQQAVQDGDTRDGYWDWVINEMQLERHSWIGSNFAE